ncbi:MAG: GAK system CofD-like protein [Deltaproteobacteria bacterium]|nr:GAK system CofD-like protein [Deltaproteobacteria bacterium]
MRITICRSTDLPEPRRIEICRRNPELGPKILFFSGGSSLRKVSQELVQYTHNSIHIIASMDSGGSSATLRKAFHMPAVGDIRHRLMALADRSVTGNPSVYQLFSHRLPKNKSLSELQEILVSMGEGRHHLVREIPIPMRGIIQDHLSHFVEKMPRDFDLQNACIGNLVITGSYLKQGQQLDPVIYLFSNLAHVRGIVKPVTDQFLHLAAELEGGSVVVGQHNLTGKEAPPLEKSIKRFFFTSSLDNDTEVKVRIRPAIKELVSQADLICFPMGSFFSSLIANCLPAGMGEAISLNPCPKVFIPNTSPDPELVGKSLVDQLKELLHYLRQGETSMFENSQLLNYVLMDDSFQGYPGNLGPEELRGTGVKAIKCKLMGRKSRPLIDERLLVGALLSLT